MSAGRFENASCLSLYKMNQHQFLNTPQVDVDKQGITSILTSDFNSKSHNQIQIVLPFHNSIRRTLSADMSSQKWLQNNGFPHSSIKRVKSSLQLQALGEQQQPTPCRHDDHDKNNKGPAFEDIWSSIQAHKNSWGCILSSGSGEVPPPYVHPLAKRTGSSLSEKSLEICTESLGSETGSDGFSYPSSDSDEEQKEEEEEEEQLMKEYNVQQQLVGVGVGVGINNSRGVGVGPTSKRAPPTRPSFPPPLPSLGHRDDGSNLHIRSHRQDGRLVVEAVSVPSQNCFSAKRQDGRLLLTFCPTHDEDEDEDGDDTDDHIYQDINSNNNNVQVIEEEKGGVVEVQVQRSCTTLTMMSKFMELTNKSSTWPRNYNTTVIKTLNHEEQHTFDEVPPLPMTTMTTTKSLPPRPTTASTALNNPYEYYWRRSNSTAVGMLNPLANAHANNNKKSVAKHSKRNNNRLLYAAHTVKKGGGGALPLTQIQHHQQDNSNVVAIRRGSQSAADEYAVPLMMLRGCKEAKKPSPLLWEPYCIATS